MHLKGMTQGRLATKAQVSQAFISLMIGGRRGVRTETAWRIASALHVKTFELFVPSPMSGYSSPEFLHADCQVSVPSGARKHHSIKTRQL
ncbi:helix-turn-helix transcriptional regulator [Streptomyces olivoreticuli]